MILNFWFWHGGAVVMVRLWIYRVAHCIVELKLYMAIPDTNRTDLAAPDSNRTVWIGI